MQYLGQYLSYYIHTGHGGRRMGAIYAHTLLDDLDWMSHWVGIGKDKMLSATKQAVSIKLATTEGQYLRDLDFGVTSLFFLSPVLCAVFSCLHTTGREAYSFTTNRYGIFDVRTHLGACRLHERGSWRHKQFCTRVDSERQTNCPWPCIIRASNPGTSD